MKQPPLLKDNAGTKARRLGIIYNRRSGRHRRRWPQHVLPADVLAIEANTPEQIDAALARLAAQGTDLLAIAGGDGTVQCILTTILLGDLFRTPPILALIPTGSTNMTSKDVGSVDVKKRGWEPLCAWAKHPSKRVGRIQSRPVLRIQAGSQSPFCGMFFGAGAIHDTVQYAQKRLYRLGLRGKIGTGLGFLRFIEAIAIGDRHYFTPLRARARDNEDHNLGDQTLLLMASTLNRLVLRIRPFWGSQNAPIAWTAIADGATHFLLHLACVVRGRRSRALRAETGYISHNAHELTLDFDGGFIVDGEVFQAQRADGPVRLSIAGHARFLAL